MVGFTKQKTPSMVFFGGLTGKKWRSVNFQKAHNHRGYSWYIIIYIIHLLIHSFIHSPPARWGLLDFIRAVVLLLLLLLLLQFSSSSSPPPPPPPPPPPVSPRPCLHQLPPPLPPCQLFAKLFANFQLSAHCWTSTWDLPSSVRTAGPQPGTFPAQCAPLDLNLGPS